MKKREEFEEQDIANMARGFDAPAHPDHLEKLLEQARERDLEMQREQEQKGNQNHEFEQEQSSSFEDLQNQLKKERSRDGRSR